jgi:hypothetical protein
MQTTFCDAVVAKNYRYGAAPSPVCFGQRSFLFATLLIVEQQKHDLFTDAVLSSNATPSESYYRLMLYLLYRELIEKERWNGGSRYRCVN